MITIQIINVLLTLVINVVNVFKLEYINNSIFFQVVILTFIFIFSICFFCVYVKFLISNYHLTEDNIKESQISNRKVEKLTIFYIAIILIPSFVFIFLFFLNIELPNNKKNYEVVFEENKPIKIIITEYKDYFILMDIEKIDKIIKIDGNEGNKLFLKKYSYELSKKERLKINYLYIDEVFSHK